MEFEDLIKKRADVQSAMELLTRQFKELDTEMKDYLAEGEPKDATMADSFTSKLAEFKEKANKILMKMKELEAMRCEMKKELEEKEKMLVEKRRALRKKEIELEVKNVMLDLKIEGKLDYWWG